LTSGLHGRIDIDIGISCADTRQRIRDILFPEDARGRRRALMAKAAGCDIFISLHLNDFDDDSANGLEVLFRDAQDRALAQKLQRALIQVTGLRDRDIKQRNDLAVLKFPGTAVLIELGFIANDADRARLLDAQVRDAITRTIASTTLEHVDIG
jgi:N-acetylmuramoyl-L-alanine amidase